MKRSSVPRKQSINGLASKQPVKILTSQEPNKDSTRNSSGPSSTRIASRCSKENVNVNIRALQKPTKAGQLKSNELNKNHRKNNDNAKKPSLLRDKKNLNNLHAINKKTSKSFHSSPSKSNILTKNNPTIVTDIERQTLNIFQEYGNEIELYQRSLEDSYMTAECLKNHEITPVLRAKMVDWMVEVLTSFKCSDRTFFLSIRTMDRYLFKSTSKKPIGELHLIGVTSMFLASKYEDVYPLHMITVYEKIGHKKLAVKTVTNCECEILKTLDYLVQAPTVYEFVKRYASQGIWTNKELVCSMAVYLAKMCSHDYWFSSVKPSLFAIGVLYISLKICEQLKKMVLINKQTMLFMTKTSGYNEDEVMGCAQKVLKLSQNFDKLFPGLTNLRKLNLIDFPNYLNR